MESEIYGKQHEKKQQYLLYKHFWELNKSECVGSFIFDMGTEKPSKCKQTKDKKQQQLRFIKFYALISFFVSSGHSDCNEWKKCLKVKYTTKWQVINRNCEKKHFNLHPHGSTGGKQK